MLITLTMAITTRPLTMSPAPRRQATATRSTITAGSTHSSIDEIAMRRRRGRALEAHHDRESNRPAAA